MQEEDMSNTPRTDGAARQICDPGNEGLGDEYYETVVDVDFARGLELKLNMAIETLKRAERHLIEARAGLLALLLNRIIKELEDET